MFAVSFWTCSLVNYGERKDSECLSGFRRDGRVARDRQPYRCPSLAYLDACCFGVDWPRDATVVRSICAVAVEPVDIYVLCQMLQNVPLSSINLSFHARRIM